ncbi:DUF1003 domain-containing protein [Teichococcus aestuarii]|uniref:Cyclic nucleotide-binding protein n=1 Tax=Teichococcus aestuarii TaxID=568898 RepID=A0A2U1V9Y7_9PROT|nr:DUF1003 domain-containing protein [Pseudoroseomonas aestuarii]PWC30730.1 hypothetical protein CR165_02180 [Pseudoroseomonas aestuarii]
MSESPKPEFREAAARWFGAGEALGEAEHRALSRALERRPLSHDTNEAFSEKLSFGDRVADKVASFGGSWSFILLSLLLLVLWTGANLWLLRQPFDPYPFVFLNLLLSMIAALQAPIIMMSQNRQSAKDRLVAAHDYEVNLKAEIEIMALHEKLDRLRAEQMTALLEKQERQIEMLTRLLEERRIAP